MNTPTVAPCKYCGITPEIIETTTFFKIECVNTNCDKKSIWAKIDYKNETIDNVRKEIIEIWNRGW